MLLAVALSLHLVGGRTPRPHRLLTAGHGLHYPLGATLLLDSRILGCARRRRRRCPSAVSGVVV